MSKEECFGRLFPELDNVKVNTETKGEVFSLIINHQPISRPKPQIMVDKKNWDKCRECKSYQSCYDLSMAQIAFQTAAKTMA